MSETMLNVPYWIGEFYCSSDKYIYDYRDTPDELERDTYEALEDVDPESYVEHIKTIMNTFNQNYG